VKEGKASKRREKGVGYLKHIGINLRIQRETVVRNGEDNRLACIDSANALNTAKDIP
jgi:hypothetical protein